jgi:hypothetical protein
VDIQLLLEAGVPSPVSCVVLPTQTLVLPLILGDATTIVNVALAGLFIAHDSLDVIFTAITSLSFNDELEYVLDVAPEIKTLFFIQLYTGVPPLIGVAEKVTFVTIPGHKLTEGDAVNRTSIGTKSVTITRTALVETKLLVPPQVDVILQ